MQLILIFIQTTDKDNIIAFIDSKPVSQIISKLLDTKYYVYFNDLSILIDVLMTKAPSVYLNNFIREGIIDNIQNYISEIDYIDNKNDENKEKNPEEKDNYFVDVYRFTLDFAESDIVLQEGETDGYQLATLEEIQQIAKDGKFLHYDSIKEVFLG